MILLMSLFLAAIGGLLIFVVLADAFTTIILPRTVFIFRPSSFFYRGIWNIWAWVARLVRNPARNQVFNSIFGPFSVILLLALWALALIVGFALLHKGLGTNIHVPEGGKLDIATLLYFSGTTFFTLGIGDVTALDPLGRFLIVFESATGFIFLALIIGYMPMLEQSYDQREVHILLLESRAGSPQSAARMLKSFHGSGHSDHFEQTLQGAEQWVASLLESHISHPLLAYYRSQHLGLSWLKSLTVLLDTCAILIASQGEKASFQEKSTFRMCRNAAMELTKALKIKPLLDPREQRVEREWKEIRDFLASCGVEISAEPAAAQRFLTLRHLYEPSVMALGKLLHIKLPEWLPQDHEEKLWPNYLEEVGVDGHPLN